MPEEDIAGREMREERKGTQEGRDVRLKRFEMASCDKWSREFEQALSLIEAPKAQQLFRFLGDLHKKHM